MKLRCFILCACAAFLFCGCSREEKAATRVEPRKVKLATVTSAESLQTYAFPGTVKAAERAKLFFRVNGPVDSIHFEVGDHVEKGAILMQLDQRDYRNKVDALESKLANLNFKLEGMKTGRPEDLTIILSAISAMRYRVENNGIELERCTKLLKSDIASQSTYDAALSRYNMSKAVLDALVTGYDRVKAGARVEDIEAMRSAIQGVQTELRVAQDQLSDASLRAPFDGIITQKMIEPHEFAVAGAPMIIMQNIDEVDIVFSVQEGIFKSLERLRGKEFNVSFSHLNNKTFPARLSEYSSEADPITRTYELTLRMKQPAPDTILPGMTAEVSGVLNPDETQRLCCIPLTAVGTAARTTAPSETKQEPFVWRYDEKTQTVHAVPVTLGTIFNNTSVFILKGLNVNDKIVCAGADYLKENEKVTPLQSKRGE